MNTENVYYFLEEYKNLIKAEKMDQNDYKDLLALINHKI